MSNPYTEALRQVYGRATPSDAKTRAGRIMAGMLGNPKHRAEYEAFIQSEYYKRQEDRAKRK